jgi:hypothetical protein
MAEDLPVGAERLAPQALAQDHDGRPVGAVLLTEERAAEQGLEAEDLEEVGRDATTSDEARRPGIAPYVVRLPIPDRDRRQTADPGLDVQEVRVREVVTYARSIGMYGDHGDDAIRVRVGIGSQQHGVHHAEDDGRSGDPQRESEDGHEAEARGAQQGAGSVNQVLEERVHLAGSPHISRRRSRSPPAPGPSWRPLR